MLLLLDSETSQETLSADCNSLFESSCRVPAFSLTTSGTLNSMHIAEESCVTCNAGSGPADLHPRFNASILRVTERYPVILSTTMLEIS